MQLALSVVSIFQNKKKNTEWNDFIFLLSSPPLYTHSYRAVGMVDAPPAKTFEYVIPGPRSLKWDKTIKVRFHTNMFFFTDHGLQCDYQGIEPLWNNVLWQSFPGSVQVVHLQMRASYSNSFVLCITVIRITSARFY